MHKGHTCQKNIFHIILYLSTIHYLTNNESIQAYAEKPWGNLITCILRDCLPTLPIQITPSLHERQQTKTFIGRTFCKACHKKNKKKKQHCICFGTFIHFHRSTSAWWMAGFNRFGVSFVWESRCQLRFNEAKNSRQWVKRSTHYLKEKKNSLVFVG